MKTLLCSLALVPVLVGCSGLAGVAKQLKNDPAVVTVQVKTLYGSGYMVRDGRANGTTTVSMDGALTSTSSTNSNFRPEPQKQVTPQEFAQLVRQNPGVASQVLASLNPPPPKTTNQVAATEPASTLKTNVVKAPRKPRNTSTNSVPVKPGS